MAGLRERKIGLPLEQALSVVIGAAAGLHHAHEKKGSDGKALNVVHGDVTPENVLITYDGGVKVTDFGIARAGRRLSEVSEAGFKAKAPYLSPEQCKSEPVDRRSDVFSLGIVLYELTTGYRLFKGLSAVEIMKKIVEAPVELPSKRRQGYPAELERIVMKALEKDPAKRFETAQAFQADLEAFARENQLAVSTIALQNFMNRVFGTKIEAWRRGTSKGTSRGSWTSRRCRFPRRAPGLRR